MALAEGALVLIRQADGEADLPHFPRLQAEADVLQGVDPVELLGQMPGLKQHVSSPSAMDFRQKEGRPLNVPLSVSALLIR